MDDQKNIKPDFSKAGEDSILYKKEEPKTEREKLKELHGKDKIWYLVHYYGLQTMVALAIIGTISFLIIHYITQKDTALEIMAVNAIQSVDLVHQCALPFFEYGHTVGGQSGWGFRLL